MIIKYDVYCFFNSLLYTQCHFSKNLLFESQTVSLNINTIDNRKKHKLFLEYIL